MLEEETDPASESDADLKYKLFQESTNFHHPIVKHPPETVGAQPLLPGTKTAKEIYNQEHVHSGATPGAGLTTSTSLPPSLPSPSVIATADTSATSTPVDRTQDSDDVEKCYLELQPKVTVEPTCDEETNGEYSADEVSVSRSSSRSPLAGLLVVAAAEERVAGGGSASPSDSETLLTASKPTSLRLPQQRSPAKYQGPYTLACDITPSPQENDSDAGASLPEIRTHDTTSACPNAVPSTSMNSIATSATSPVSGCSNISGGGKPARRPRKLPEIPRKHQGLATASSAKEKSIFDEIQEALIKEVTEDEVFETETTNTTVEAFQASQYPFILKHVGHLFDKKRLLVGYNPTPSRSRNISTSSETGAGASLEEETASAHAKTRASSSSSSTLSWCSGQRRRKNSDGDAIHLFFSGSKRYSSSFATAYQDLEVTHRGMHRFIPRHADEVQVGIGDPIHVIKEYDDLWCEGVNLRTGERGIFPAMYANDLRFLEDSDGEEADYWKFTMRYLGSVEVNAPHGDHALCQAITRVAQQGRIKTASLSTLEINQYGIRMIDKSKDGVLRVHHETSTTESLRMSRVPQRSLHAQSQRCLGERLQEVLPRVHGIHTSNRRHLDGVIAQVLASSAPDPGKRP
ncbi:hypothetical protein C0Q70_11782 [Pomacea canaliculata]|uniref:SH3 domain-containing protein n=1 Tax=Pomacea canaliculata TaxID=400727 RepID=A0A2T7P6Y2_POMCA|nr:hypothetical protein C0Q70_11782 [Pomacea canaliculata]